MHERQIELATSKNQRPTWNEVMRSALHALRRRMSTELTKWAQIGQLYGSSSGRSYGLSDNKTSRKLPVTLLGVEPFAGRRARWCFGQRP
jgi:hypothetical protein